MYVLCSIVMKNETIEGLGICYGVANTLKEKYPNEIMKIKYDTILPHQAKNRKCCGKNMSGYAWYTNQRPPRIVIKQRVLSDRVCWRTKVKNQRDRVKLNGNFALIELMCHELAHHRTSGHAKGFKIKYHRFLDYMVNKVISGEYYQS